MNRTSGKGVRKFLADTARLTTSQVALLAGVTSVTVRNAIKRGALPAFNHGTPRNPFWLVEKTAAETYAEAHRSGVATVSYRTE
jgi:hypothetical protein